jgi:hypothetical protein
LLLLLVMQVREVELGCGHAQPAAPANADQTNITNTHLLLLLLLPTQVREVELCVDMPSLLRLQTQTKPTESTYTCCCCCSAAAAAGA